MGPSSVLGNSMHETQIQEPLLLPNTQFPNQSPLFESYDETNRSQLNPRGADQQNDCGYDSDGDVSDNLVVDEINEDQEMEHNGREYISSSFDDLGHSEDERILLDRNGNPLAIAEVNYQSHSRQQNCMMPVKTELARCCSTLDQRVGDHGPTQNIIK